MPKWRSYRRLPPTEKGAARAALVLNPLFRVWLRLFGYRRSTRLAALLSTSRHRTSLTPGEQIALARELASGVDRAGRQPYAGAVCLPRSLTLTVLLTRRGIDGTIRLGAAHRGGQFMAHAWVEVGGSPVNDSSDVAERFAPFPEPSLPRAGTEWA